jgi:hypothetical protein
MLFKEIITVYYRESYETNIMQNAELPIVKAGGTYFISLSIIETMADVSLFQYNYIELLPKKKKKLRRKQRYFCHHQRDAKYGPRQ